MVSYFFFSSYQTRVIILYWYQRRNTACNNQYICLYFSKINEQYFNVVVQIVRLLFLYTSHIDQLQNDRFLSIIQHYLQRCQTWNRTGRSFLKIFTVSMVKRYEPESFSLTKFQSYSKSELHIILYEFIMLKKSQPNFTSWCRSKLKISHVEISDSLSKVILANFHRI